MVRLKKTPFISANPAGAATLPVGLFVMHIYITEPIQTLFDRESHNPQEQTFVVFWLRAFSTNPRKEILKNSKSYFWDTGIRNALLNAFSTEPFRPDIGALWENRAMAEIVKHSGQRQFS